MRGGIDLPQRIWAVCGAGRSVGSTDCTKSLARGTVGTTRRLARCDDAVNEPDSLHSNWPVGDDAVSFDLAGGRGARPVGFDSDHFGNGLGLHGVCIGVHRATPGCCVWLVV